MLVKFAAKRTWPEKASSWEHEGDADTVEAFAAEFAAIEQLPVDTEMVVMSKGDGGPSTQFLKVVGTSPYAFEPVEPGKQAPAPAASSSDEPSQEQEQEQEEDQPVALPSLSPVISMLWYMGKVAVIATVVIATLAILISYLKSWLA
ncbi:hypothetical protein G3446_06035 [Thiorhodococcus minor]|uniref:Uncharacterized protein n=2 Tax=Thiorhodococcus minor TaxID=57489 RepID=A0A6M0JYL0_9GAMM|nr:hypothetical protein [Thiorhodococcus minor]